MRIVSLAMLITTVYVTQAMDISKAEVYKFAPSNHCALFEARWEKINPLRAIQVYTSHERCYGYYVTKKDGRIRYEKIKDEQIDTYYLLLRLTYKAQKIQKPKQTT